MMMMTSLRVVKLLWEIPFCLLSFLFYRFMRIVLTTLAKRHPNKQQSRPAMKGWIGLSEFMHMPLALPYIMVTGPRWNCHAVLGILGPFDVQSHVRINVEHCRRSAGQWTVVFYDSKGKTSCSAGSINDSGTSEWKEFDMQSGQYSIAMRYYHCRPQPVFPAVQIDGHEYTSKCPIREEYKSYTHFLERIRDYRGTFYLFLHYYVFKLIAWREWLPESFVKKELLPVGNPETQFLYGPVRKDTPLTFTFDPEVFNTAGVYMSLYNT